MLKGRGWHAGVAQGLEALRAGGVAPKLLIIDDGWQSTALDDALRPGGEEGEVIQSENKVGAVSTAFACMLQDLHRGSRSPLQDQQHQPCWLLHNTEGKMA